MNMVNVSCGAFILLPIPRPKPQPTILLIAAYLIDGERASLLASKQYCVRRTNSATSQRNLRLLAALIPNVVEIASASAIAATANT